MPPPPPKIDDGLAEALEKQKTANAETDALDVLCRALEVDRSLVVRILYAMSAINTALRDHHKQAEFDFGHDGYSTSSEVYNRELPDLELRSAYREAMEAGVRRMIVGRAIRNGKPIRVATASWLPSEEASQLCKACPERLECIAESLSEPVECWKWEKSTLQLTPLRMNKKAAEFDIPQLGEKRFFPLEQLMIERTTASARPPQRSGERPGPWRNK